MFEALESGYCRQLDLCLGGGYWNALSLGSVVMVRVAEGGTGQRGRKQDGGGAQDEDASNT